MNLASDPGADRLATARVADRLSDPSVETYLTGNGHRIAAARFLLEALQLPLPQWAERGISGRRAETKAAIARFRQDTPDLDLSYGYRPPRQP